MSHTAIARLRGRAEPREDILDRLLQINPQYRVSWVPPGAPQQDHQGEEYQRPGMWRVYELNPVEIRRAAGWARLQRFEKWSQEKQAANIGLAYEAQDWIDGLHLVGEFAEGYFGADQMFEMLKHDERALAESRTAVAQAQQADADRQAEEEMDENPEFTDYVRETAKEWYNRVKGNASVAVATSLRSE